MPDHDPIRNTRAAPSQFPAILWTLGIGFGLRAGLVLAAAFTTSGPIVHYSPDSESYLSAAREMAVTGRFTRGGEPELVRTPGYPLLLELGVRSGQVETVTITLQILLSCATVWVVYRISRLVFEREGVAQFCALLYAVEPLSIVYTTKLLSETLFAFALTSALWGLVGYLQTGGRLALVGSAVASASSIYVRPVAYFLPALVGVALAVRALLRSRSSTSPTVSEGGHPSPPPRWVDAVLFVAVSMAFVGAWQVRNVVEAGYGGFTAIGDEALYFYQGASVIAAQESKPYYDVQKELGYHDRSLFDSMHLEQANWTRAEKYRWLRREGRNIVLAHPMIYAWIHAKGVVRLMLDPGGFEYLRLLQAYPASGGLLGNAVDRGLWSVVAKMWRERPGAIVLNAALGLMLLGYLALAAVGAVSRALWRNAALVAMFVIAVYLVVMSGGPQTEGRFRHPVMPIVCVMAGSGWMTLMGRSKKRSVTSAS